MAPHSRKIDAPSAPPRRDRRIARHRARLAAGALAAIAIAAGLAWGVPRWRAAERAGPPDAELNRGVAERVIGVHQALQFHGQRPWRKPDEPLVPPSAGFMTFMKQLEDGDGERLLANPFGGPPQARAIPVAEAEGLLPTAAERAAGKRPARALQALGPGLRPQDGPYGVRTYGALIYDGDPRGGRYVIYGIGRQGDQAVLVHQTSGP